MKGDELERTIATLRAGYLKQLPATAAKLQVLWSHLAAEGVPSAPMDELARMVHSIAGSAATLGVAGASEAARELELLLDRLHKSGRMPGDAEQQAFSALLAVLAQASARS